MKSRTTIPPAADTAPAPAGTGWPHRADFYGELTPGEHELLADIAEIAAERDQAAAERDEYATEASDLRERLAAAILVQTEQAATIAALREQLHKAGMAPTGRRWQRIGAAA